MADKIEISPITIEGYFYEPAKTRYTTAPPEYANYFNVQQYKQ